jgi:hypothetical protein
MEANRKHSSSYPQVLRLLATWKYHSKHRKLYQHREGYYLTVFQKYAVRCWLQEYTGMPVLRPTRKEKRQHERGLRYVASKDFSECKPIGQTKAVYDLTRDQLETLTQLWLN